MQWFIFRKIYIEILTRIKSSLCSLILIKAHCDERDVGSPNRVGKELHSRLRMATYRRTVIDVSYYIHTTYIHTITLSGDACRGDVSPRKQSGSPAAVAVSHKKYNKDIRTVSDQNPINKALWFKVILIYLKYWVLKTEAQLKNIKYLYLKNIINKFPKLCGIINPPSLLMAYIKLTLKLLFYIHNLSWN